MTTNETVLHQREQFEWRMAGDPAGFGERYTVPSGWIYIVQGKAVFVPEPFELLPATIDYFEPKVADL